MKSNKSGRGGTAQRPRSTSSAAKRGAKSSKSRQATAKAKAGQPLRAKRSSQRSPKQENL